jgi:hypothetical protein
MAFRFLKEIFAPGHTAPHPPGRIVVSHVTTTPPEPLCNRKMIIYHRIGTGRVIERNDIEHELDVMTLAEKSRGRIVHASDYHGTLRKVGRFYN